MSLTSRGTILTREANVFVAVDLMSSSESLMRPSTGTIMKMTYGKALMSSFCTMSIGIISKIVTNTCNELTICQFCGALPVVEVESVSEERYDLLNGVAHSGDSNNIAHRRKGTSSALSYDGKFASKGKVNERE